MNVFVTGATGFIGSTVVAELLAAGHSVVGLTRSDDGARRLAEAGAAAFRADLTDTEAIATGANAADAVIHLAYQQGPDAVAADCALITAVGGALAGSGRPFVITSGTLVLPSGTVGVEADAADPNAPAGARGANEAVALDFAERDVRVSVVRPAPSVHDRVRRGFVGALIDAARSHGSADWVQDGTPRWAAVHRLDIAALYRLAVESAPAGTVLHGVGDEAVLLRDIATEIGTRLDVPVRAVPASDAADGFGWLGSLATVDAPASSAATRQLLGWQPTHVGLLDDLRTGDFFDFSS